ncbi:MAG: hypothetical protein ABIP51_22895 [Bacteroidia bacterium]
MLCLLIIVSGCKKPHADFTTDKDEYYLGEIIHLTNTSRSAKKYTWKLFDGSIRTSEKVDCFIDPKTPLGNVDIQLETTSHTGQKYSKTRSFKIKQKNGHVVIWTKKPGFVNANIIIFDGSTFSPFGSISAMNASDPGCQYDQGISKVVAAGLYTFIAKDSNGNLLLVKNNINVELDGCYSIEF